MGLDVPAWIAEGFIDYVSPADTMYCEPNVPLEAFSRLTRSTPCFLYPGLLPWSSLRMRRRLGGQPITSDQQRALAMNMYGAGADGIFFYNHFVPLSWAPFLPSNAAGTGRDPGAAGPDPRQPPLCLRAGLGGVPGVWRRPDLHRSGQGRPNGAETGNSGG